jgi:hypothetical protein
VAGKVSPGPLEERQAIATVLPQGVSFDSPVIPDVLYGESSKTVEDALANLQAYVRGQTIHDGGSGARSASNAAARGQKRARARSSSRSPRCLTP